MSSESAHPKKPDKEPRQPSMDDVLKRMLSTPPKQHKDEKVGKTPQEKKGPPKRPE